MWTSLRAIVSRLTFMLARRRLDEDLRLEIDAHLESLTERFRQQGMSADEALGCWAPSSGFTASCHSRPQSDRTVTLAGGAAIAGSCSPDVVQ